MKKFITILSAFSISLAAFCAEDEKIRLSENGSALMPIVVSDNPSRAEDYAAKDLKKHLDEISGGDFKILKVSEAKDAKAAIYVGNTPKSRELAPDFDAYKAPFDTTLIRTANGNLLINGHSRRGTLYAVYAFLEDTLGVKWWTPEQSHIPKIPTIEIGGIDSKYSPALVFRQTNYIEGSFDWKFAARLKNGQLNPDDEELAKEISQSFAMSYHSFFKILPPKKYFKDHPEWYSEIDGKRTAENSQLCLTDEEMTKEFIKVVLEKLDKKPYARFTHISQNDWRGWCTCAKCKAFEDAHGGKHSATVLNFVNKVAEAVEKKYPDNRIVTFAYQYTRQMPENIKPRGNVWIELCSIECDFAHPLESDTDYGFTKDIKDWSQITKNLTIWNYTTCFSNYVIPYPNIYLIGGDIRFFVKNGAIGLFQQGNSFCNVGDFNAMRLWVMSKLMWNPQLDDKKLIDEFLNGYYSPEIAEIYKKYLDTIEKRARKVKYAQGCDYVDTLTWMDVKTYNKAASYMKKALAKAKELEKTDPVKYKGLVRKVWRDKLPIDFVGVMYNVQLHRAAEKAGIELKHPTDAVQTAQDILNRFKNFNTHRIVPYMTLEKFKSTWVNFMAYAQTQKDYLQARPQAHNPKDLLSQFKAGTFEDFQEDRIEQGGNGWAEGWSQMPSLYVEDADASNGYAAKCSDGKRFEIQLRDTLFKLKSASGDEKSNKFKIYAFIKNPGKAVKPGRYAWLNYNKVTSTRLQRETLKTEIPHTDKYEMMEIGTLEHTDITRARKDAVCMQFYLYCGKNSDILVDRFVFVRQ